MVKEALALNAVCGFEVVDTELLPELLVDLVNELGVLSYSRFELLQIVKISREVGDSRSVVALSAVYLQDAQTFASLKGDGLCAKHYKEPVKNDLLSDCVFTLLVLDVPSSELLNRYLVPDHVFPDLVDFSLQNNAVEHEHPEGGFPFYTRLPLLSKLRAFTEVGASLRTLFKIEGLPLKLVKLYDDIPDFTANFREVLLHKNYLLLIRHFALPSGVPIVTPGGLHGKERGRFASDGKRLRGHCRSVLLLLHCRVIVY